MSAPEPALRRIDAIVIGASAGGVDALSTLLPALPATLPAAVFIVLHLPRERPSLLAEIFSRKCVVPVREAQDKEPVAPGTVYFAPPDYHLLLDNGPLPEHGGGAGRRTGPQLALSVDESVHFSRPSIDVLFESAADVYGKRLLGIILTGANEDGAAGLAAVHEAGGQTIVQQPQSAHSSLMIVSALKRSSPDFIMSLEQIAAVFRTLQTKTDAAVSA